MSRVSVCTDCYFAHHYGATEAQTKTGTVWFAGESDSFTDLEPLRLLEGLELADATDSETGEGLECFSWRSCEGCGSSLGGSRFALAVLERVQA